MFRLGKMFDWKRDRKPLSRSSSRKLGLRTLGESRIGVT